MRRTRLGSMVSGATASVVGGILMAAGLSGVASAAGTGYAEPGQIGFQVCVTPIANEIHGFHDNILLPIIVVICIFVAALLLICVFRFNETAHPVPSKSTHNIPPRATLCSANTPLRGSPLHTCAALVPPPTCQPGMCALGTLDSIVTCLVNNPS